MRKTYTVFIERWTRFSFVDLARYGKYYELFMLSYSQFIPIADQYRSFDYKIRYPLYIAGESHAQILLSTVQNPGLDDDVIEITIGALGNTLSKITNRINGREVMQASELGLLSPHVPVKMIIDVSKEGVVNVFTSHNPWEPLLSATFPNHFEPKYISFASYGRVEFFYDIDEAAIQQLPTTHDMTMEFDAIDHVKHPLLEKHDYPIGMAELFFKKFYNVFVTTPTPIADKYVKFVQLSDFVDVLPDNYIARIPFYVRGNNDAYVLFSSTANPTPYDGAYELCKLFVTFNNWTCMISLFFEFLSSQ